MTKEEDMVPLKPYIPNPKIYEDKEGNLIGVIVLTEDCATALPLDPAGNYLVDGKKISDWRLYFFSITKDCQLGFIEYYEGLDKIRKIADFGNKYVIGEKDGCLITTPLTHEELCTLLQ